MSADEIATAFTDHYYSMRQTDQGGADQLAGLFVSRIDQCRITVHYSTSIEYIHIYDIVPTNLIITTDSHK